MATRKAMLIGGLIACAVLMFLALAPATCDPARSFAIGHSLVLAGCSSD